MARPVIGRVVSGATFFYDARDLAELPIEPIIGVVAPNEPAVYLALPILRLTGPDVQCIRVVWVLRGTVAQVWAILDGRILGDPRLSGLHGVLIVIRLDPVRAVFRAPNVDDLLLRASEKSIAFGF